MIFNYDILNYLVCNYNYIIEYYILYNSYHFSKIILNNENFNYKNIYKSNSFELIQKIDFNNLNVKHSNTLLNINNKYTREMSKLYLSIGGFIEKNSELSKYILSTKYFKPLIYNYVLSNISNLNSQNIKFIFEEKNYLLIDFNLYDILNELNRIHIYQKKNHMNQF